MKEGRGGEAVQLLDQPWEIWRNGCRPIMRRDFRYTRHGRGKDHPLNKEKEKPIGSLRTREGGGFLREDKLLKEEKAPWSPRNSPKKGKRGGGKKQEKEGKGLQ